MQHIVSADRSVNLDIVDDLRDCGPIPEFLLRHPPANDRLDLGCATQPSDLIKAGQQAWARLQAHQTWDDWKVVGFALAEGRTKAMAAAKTNQPKGSRYNKIYSNWLGARGFSDLGKSTRARLLQCTENIAAIDAWLQTLKADKRLKLNHPTSVLSAWKRATTAPEPSRDNESAPDWVAAWNKASPAARTAGYTSIDFKTFLADIPPAWRDELLRRRDSLNKDKPDSKVTAAIKTALSHIASTGDAKTGETVAKSNENAALNDLRGALRVIDGLDHTLHDIEIRLVRVRSRRKRPA